MTTTYSSSPKEWLSLPNDLDMNDSFADDLIRQFDKKRTGLHKELGQQTSSPSPSSFSAIPPTPPPKSPTRNNSDNLQQQQQQQQQTEASTSNPRRSSATDLLRRSSAFLKATWSRSHPPKKETCSSSSTHTTTPPSPSLLPATIAINTTITLPLTKKSSTSFPSLQPPVISHYPPKPLKYSPVDPSEEDQEPSQQEPRQRRKTLIHRISMPALRRPTTDDQGQVSHHRRKSDGPLFRKKKSSHP